MKRVIFCLLAEDICFLYNITYSILSGHFQPWKDNRTDALIKLTHRYDKIRPEQVYK